MSLYSMRLSRFFIPVFICVLIASCAHNGGVKRGVSSIGAQLNPILVEDADYLPLAQVVNIKPTDLSNKSALLRLVGVYSNVEYSPLVDLVNLAQASIDIEIYEMDEPTFVEALKRAVDRGVRVRIIKDPSPVSSQCDLFDDGKASQSKISESCKQAKELRQYIVNSRGGAFVPFVKAELCGKSELEMKGTCFQHGKMVVVDNTVALVSTGNFNASNLCTAAAKKCNRDFSYVTRDFDVIAGLKAVFNKDLKQKRYALKELLDASPGFGQKFSVSPYSLDPLIEMIRLAKHTLRIQNQYMNEKEWNQAIQAAARRGVKVELMLTSACSYGPPAEKQKKKLAALYQEFEGAGVSLRFFTSHMKQKGRDGYLHSKIMVLDGEKAWLGSVNGSTSATSYNREFGIFFNNPERVRKLEDVLIQDFAHEDSEDWRETLNCVKDR